MARKIVKDATAKRMDIQKRIEGLIQDINAWCAATLFDARNGEQEHDYNRLWHIADELKAVRDGKVQTAK